MHPRCWSGILKEKNSKQTNKKGDAYFFFFEKRDAYILVPNFWYGVNMNLQIFFCSPNSSLIPDKEYNSRTSNMIVFIYFLKFSLKIKFYNAKKKKREERAEMEKYKDRRNKPWHWKILNSATNKSKNLSHTPISTTKFHYPFFLSLDPLESNAMKNLIEGSTVPIP